MEKAVTSAADVPEMRSTQIRTSVKQSQRVRAGSLVCYGSFLELRLNVTAIDWVYPGPKASDRPEFYVSGRAYFSGLVQRNRFLGFLQPD